MRFGSRAASLIAGGAAADGRRRPRSPGRRPPASTTLRGPLDVTATGGRGGARRWSRWRRRRSPRWVRCSRPRACLRRVVGGVIAAAAASWSCWLGIRGLLHEPADVLFGPTHRCSPADVADPPARAGRSARVGGLALRRRRLRRSWPAGSGARGARRPVRPRRRLAGKRLGDQRRSGAARCGRSSTATATRPSIRPARRPRRDRADRTSRHGDPPAWSDRRREGG